MTIRYAAFPGHTCTNFVKVGPAARAAGVPYQYVFGMAKRNVSSKRPRISVETTTLWNGKAEIKVCLECVTSKYGKAADNTDNKVLRAEPIVGYRTWDIRDNQLVSWFDGMFVWLPGSTEAKCAKAHTPPGNRCRCGLYARPSITGPFYDGDVLGQVELWGNYSLGSEAHRGQFGQPTALLCDDWRKADAIHLVAQLYRVPVLHSKATLASVSWGELNALGGTTDGSGQEDRGGRGPATPSGRGPDGTPGRAACRGRTLAAGTLEDLKQLIRDGEISRSNVDELFE